MINVTVERENGRTLLILNTKDRVSYTTHKILVKNRFYVPDFDKWWIWRGPDTDTAEQTANEIAATYNSKQK